VLVALFGFSNPRRRYQLLTINKRKYMSDNKKNIGQPDRNLISFKQKYEFEYAVKQLQNQVPDTTKQSAKDALTDAARKISPSEGREKIMREARKNLRD
jgi:hypothetical protein